LFAFVAHINDYKKKKNEIYLFIQLPWYTMSATKHHKKKHHKRTKHQNENNDEQSNDHLFSEADAKSVEVSGYTVGHGAPQSNQRIHEGGIPTGVGKFYII